MEYSMTLCQYKKVSGNLRRENYYSNLNEWLSDWIFNLEL